MKLTAKVLNNKVIGTVYEHNGFSVYLDVSKGDIKRLVNVDRFYQPLNDYLATLSETSQQIIIEAVSEASDLFKFDGEEKGEGFLTDLQSIFTTIVDELDLEGAQSFYKDYRGFAIPELFDGGGNYSPETTYDNPQYRDLLGLICICKLLAPLWIEPRTIIHEIVGKNRRDWTIYKMLENTALSSMDAYSRLLVYVEGNLKKDLTLPPSIALEGYTLEQIPELLMAHLIYRTIHKCETTEPQAHDMQGNFKPNNIAGVIKTILSNQPQGKVNEFGTSVNKIFIPGDKNQSDEGNTSFSESLSAQEDKTTITTTSIEKGASKLEWVINYIDPDLDRELVESFANHFDKYGLERNNIKNTLLLPLVSSHLGLSPWENISAVGYRNIYACAAALFHTRKYYDLVRYLFSKEAPKDISEMSSLQHRAKNAKLSDKCLDVLMATYPQTSKLKIQKFGGSAKNTNITLNPVALVNHIVDCICSKQLVEYSPNWLEVDQDMCPDGYNINQPLYPTAHFKDVIAVYLHYRNTYNLKIKEQQQHWL